MLPPRRPTFLVHRVPFLSLSVLRTSAGRGRLLRFVLLLGFLILAGRYWHPYHGFTQFLQIDAEVATRMVPVLRDAPIYIHENPGGYDGAYYAQIATNPALNDPALKAAIDDAGYRSRRILLSAVAWALGGGEPVTAARAYATLNLVLWFALAIVLWGIFPLDTWRGNFAWAAVLFSAGVLFSVRLALTDLAALLLTAIAGLLLGRAKPGAAGGFIGLAALTRETAVLGLVMFWENLREILSRPKRTLLVLVAALLPLALWLLYVRHTFGGSSVGQSNLALPLAGWLARWPELVRGWDTAGNPFLVVESVLEHIALTVQAIYLVWRPQKDCRWWRLGMASLLLMIVLGHAVWGGFPNATSRVLLPLTLAFNVRAVRDRARLGWFLLGNLSIFAGLHAFWLPPGTPHELPAHRTWETRTLLETDDRWSVAEWSRKYRWAWCAENGGLSFRMWPHRPQAQLELQLRGVTPRELEVWHEGRVVWEGRIGDRPQWITLPALPAVHGRLQLELRSPTPPTDEGANNTARSISFACFGARLVD